MHAAHRERLWQGTRHEHPFLVEHAIIGQIDLEALARDFAAVQQQHGVVKPAVLQPGRAHQHSRTAVIGITREFLYRGAGVFLQCGLEHQIFRRIAHDEEFGEQNNIRAACNFLNLGTGGAGARQIAGDVAHHRI